MMNMKKAILGLVGGLLMTASANAGFIVNGNTSPAFSGGGFDAYVLTAFNNGAAGSGTSLSSMDVTVTSAANMRVNFRDTDGDTVADANPLGTGMSFTNSTQYILGTFGRVGALASFNSVAVDPSPTTTDSDGDGEADRTPNPLYNALHQLHIAGFTTAATPPVANVGNGTPFLVVVLPTGGAAVADIGLGSETAVGTAIVALPIGNVVVTPEPASIGMLALGATMLGARRRRNA